MSLAVAIREHSADTVGLDAVRRELRRQIGRLEAQLAGHVRDLPRTAPVAAVGEARIAGVEELERTRDRLVARLSDARQIAAGRSAAEADARARREAMYRNPEAHKWERVFAEQAGEAGCVEYRVVPRLGPIGLLMNWWRVKVSSGCPLAAPREAATGQPHPGSLLRSPGR